MASDFPCVSRWVRRWIWAREWELWYWMSNIEYQGLNEPIYLCPISYPSEQNWIDIETELESKLQTCYPTVYPPFFSNLVADSHLLAQWLWRQSRFERDLLASSNTIITITRINQPPSHITPFFEQRQEKDVDVRLHASMIACICISIYWRGELCWVGTRDLRISRKLPERLLESLRTATYCVRRDIWSLRALRDMDGEER